jgi:hypothetical protein
VLQNQPDPNHVERVDPSSTTFQVVAFGICLAFEILESTAAMAALHGTGEKVLGPSRPQARREGPLKLPSGAPFPADLVSKFLAEIRADFPNIAISNRVPGDAYTIRGQWYPDSNNPAKEPTPPYKPKEAGVLFIDKGVSVLPPSSRLSFFMAVMEVDMPPLFR